MVKRTTSALLIVCMLWAFIGYKFTERYLGGSAGVSVVGAAILCGAIVLIERQIILGGKSVPLYLFRGLIAIVMALIGSLILDQIIFKEDVEQQKLLSINEKINEVLPQRTAELKKQINYLDSIIHTKEVERSAIMAEKPTRYSTNTTVTIDRPSSNDPQGKPRIIRTTTTTEIPNPKYTLFPRLDSQLQYLYLQKHLKDSSILIVRTILENELLAKKGFLDELKLMYDLLSDSRVALVVWLAWFVFFLGIELFILAGKISEKENDYHATIRHQMELQLKKLNLLSRTVINPDGTTA